MEANFATALLFLTDFKVFKYFQLHHLEVEELCLLLGVQNVYPHIWSGFEQLFFENSCVLV